MAMFFSLSAKCLLSYFGFHIYTYSLNYAAESHLHYDIKSIAVKAHIASITKVLSTVQTSALRLSQM